MTKKEDFDAIYALGSASRQAEIDELRAKLAAAETSANELRRAVAELIGADPETWPNHGNAPLAIAACVASRQAELDALMAQEPVAYVRFQNGEFDYDADAVISNTPGDCMDESIEWLPVYAAAGAAPVPRMTGAALASQEPVAEVLLVDGEKVIDASMAFFDSVELGTKLYLAAGAAPAKEPDDQIPGLGSDESAFIRWAEKEKYDLSCHPMFFVMLNEKTYAARMGWKAAKAYYGKEAQVQQVFGGRVDTSYVNGPMEEASAAKVPEEQTP